MTPFACLHGTLFDLFSFKTSLGAKQVVVRLRVCFPLPQSNVEDLLHNGGVDTAREAVRVR
jgi:hypothetical protein